MTSYTLYDLLTTIQPLFMINVTVQPLFFGGKFWTARLQTPG